MCNILPNVGMCRSGLSGESCVLGGTMQIAKLIFLHIGDRQGNLSLIFAIVGSLQQRRRHFAIRFPMFDFGIEIGHDFQEIGVVFAFAFEEFVEQITSEHGFIDAFCTYIGQ